jgi:hypothetical protein
MSPKYRLIRYDALNWAIQVWHDARAAVGGGKATKAGWAVPKAYYPNLRQAALALLDKVSREQGDITDPLAIMAAVSRSQRIVVDAVAAVESKDLVPA